MYISLETDITEAMELLKDIEHNENKIRKSALSQMGTKARTAAKRSYASVLHKRSGNLYKSIRKYLYRNGKAVVVTAHNKDDKNRYGFALAHGFTSEAKDHPTLTFRIGDKWISKHSVTVKAHDFIEGPVTRCIDSPQADKDLDNIIQKQLERLEKKRNAQ